MIKLEVDQEYIIERNMLIPFAEDYANAFCGVRPRGESNKDAQEIWAAKWNRAFMTEMTRLWKCKKENEK